jgi:hypothetical protein
VFFVGCGVVARLPHNHLTTLLPALEQSPTIALSLVKWLHSSPAQDHHSQMFPNNLCDWVRLQGLGPILATHTNVGPTPSLLSAPCNATRRLGVAFPQIQRKEAVQLERSLPLYPPPSPNRPFPDHCFLRTDHCLLIITVMI